MKKVYFSHSWHHSRLNEYFLDLLRPCDMDIIGDRESKIFCVPKLERFIYHSEGFVAVVPQRPTEDENRPYSQYIEVEIRLALHTGLPVLIFVEDSIEKEFTNRVAADIILFRGDGPEIDQVRHRGEINRFSIELEDWSRQIVLKQKHRLREVAIFRVVDDQYQAEISGGIEKILDEHGYKPTTYSLDDVEDFVCSGQAHRILRSFELSVFCLEPGGTQLRSLSWVADALGVPKFRLMRNPEKAADKPFLDGSVVWDTPQRLYGVFQELFESYRRGTPKVISRKDQAPGIPPKDEWDPEDPESLLRFIPVKDTCIQNYLYQITQDIDGGKGFPELLQESRSRELCEAVYNRICSHGWLYDFERGSADYSRQVIRTPEEIFRDQKGCCLDFACLFAALFENMQANPVVVRVCSDRFAHAVVGCWHRNALTLPIIREKEPVKRAIQGNELLLFETTGVARTLYPVAREPREWRKKGKGFLSFHEAVETARNLICSKDVEVDFVLNVLPARLKKI